MTTEELINNVSVKRLGKGGYLHSVIPVLDSSGQVIERIVKPLMVELRMRDVMQILVGSSILAIPMAFTEETWHLSQSLPLINVVIIGLISILFIGLFVYVNFYRFYLKNYIWQYVKRVLAIYLLSLIVVGLLMTLIQQCPWGVDNLLAVKRIILVAFPASMSATVTDVIK